MNLPYILDDQGNPVLCLDRAKQRAWDKSPASDQFRVGNEHIDGHWISTCLQPFDLEGEDGVESADPIVWETMVFGPGEGMDVVWQDRCGGNRTNAVAMHARAVTEIRRRIKQHDLLSEICAVCEHRLTSHT